MAISRRQLLAGGAVSALGVALLRPADRGEGYSDYFASLNSTLKAHGIDKPSLVIDLDRLDRNIDRVTDSVAKGSEKRYRVVTKSIPSPGLVEYVARRADTLRQMVFHRPFLQAMTRLQPDADLLLGKPLPVAAADNFYQRHLGSFDAERQLQWLVDTPQRLAQYLELAQTRGTRLGINLELDVGLRRGGFVADASLAEALRAIEENPEHLRFTGFMGYDAHLMGIPSFLVEGEIPKVRQRYDAAVRLLRSNFANLYKPDLCFNGAGSPTFRHYEGDEHVNDLSAGSCLMKPTHYDLPILEDFEAASFIATPVLKKLQGSRLPAMAWTAPLMRGWDVNRRVTYFTYGGNWLADNESPPGLSPHFAYVSSNQQGFNASESVKLGIDDFVFLRPQQSEAVLLQFGDLLAVRGQEIVDRWPVLRNEFNEEHIV